MHEVEHRENIYLFSLNQWEWKVRPDVISQNPNDFFRKLSPPVCRSIYALDFSVALYQGDTAEVNHYLVTVYSTGGCGSWFCCVEIM